MRTRSLCAGPELKLSAIPEISAIYFSLLQCGYDYYAVGRSPEHIQSIQAFVDPSSGCPFFSQVRQSSCNVYPYWPRAFLLEAASFFTHPREPGFLRFSELEKQIRSFSNIADAERKQAFWDWLSNFPQALQQVIDSERFHTYLRWEAQWLDRQDLLHMDALREISQVLSICSELYHSDAVKEVSIVLNPIKCIYSSDCHLFEGHFIFCSGRFDKESIIHEFLHYVAHPVVEAHRELILQRETVYPEIDPSYYSAGPLNAFEEYFVRKLTDAVSAGVPPADLNAFLKSVLEETDCHTSVPAGSQ